MIRFGLISFAHVHSDGYAWALRSIEQEDHSVKLVAISDTDSSRGEPKAREWNAKFFSDYHEMLRSGEIDAVIISSENSRHAEEIVACAEAGIHMICEKPVAISEAQLATIRGALEKKQIVFQTAFVCRYSPAVVEAKCMIDSGSLGSIRAISATNHGRYPGGWFGDPSLSGGGAIIDHTVHAADVIRLLTGDEFGTVRAFRPPNLRSDLQVEDAALLYAHMDRTGIPISIDCSWSRHDKWPTWGDLQLMIVAEKGAIRIDAFKPHINVSTNSGFEWHSLGEDLNVKLIRSFTNAVNAQTGTPTRVHPGYADDPSLRADFQAGAQAARVALAAYESLSKSSQPIPLTPPPVQIH